MNTLSYFVKYKNASEKMQILTILVHQRHSAKNT